MMTAAPDLRDGYIVNGTVAYNSWATRIQCVLSDGSDPAATAYLSQECRFENVPFCLGSTSGSSDIIKSHEPHRFLTYSQGGMFHQLPDADGPIRPPTHAVDVGGGLLIPAVTYPEWTSEVHCGDVEVEELEVEDLLAGLNNRAIPAGQVHVRVTTADGHILHFPAGYINFANRGKERGEYVQTISGDVLFPVASMLATGYMACAVAVDGRSKIEFVTKSYSDLYRHIADLTRVIELGRMAEVYPLFVGTTNFVVDVDGEATFYRYL